MQWIGIALGVLLCSTSWAVSSSDSEPQPINLPTSTPNTFELCTQNLLLNGDDSLTVGEIRQQCTSIKITEKVLSQRSVNEALTEKNPFVLTPHRLNYVIFGHYMPSVNQQPFEAQNPDKTYSFQDTELQFQFSFKVPVAKKVLGMADIYAAYTNRSFWQFFDDKDSIPFRETNHEPELWAELETDIDVFDFNLHKVLMGINHQSNGQSGLLSRGWNRLFVQGLLQNENGFIGFKTWQQFDENDEFDNSFDYTKYLGDYELELGYRSNKHTYGITVRNGYKINQFGSYKLDYTYPLTKKIKGYVQFHRGYGDSLIDLDYFSNKIGIGIVLADRI